MENLIINGNILKTKKVSFITNMNYIGSSFKANIDYSKHNMEILLKIYEDEKIIINYKGDTIIIKKLSKEYIISQITNNISIAFYSPEDIEYQYAANKE